MKRVAFTIAATTSLLLFAVAVFCSVRGYWRTDILRFPVYGSQWVYIVVQRHAVWFGTWQWQKSRPPERAGIETGSVELGDSIANAYDGGPRPRFFGFRFANPSMEERYCAASAPSWFLLMATATLPTVWVVKTVRRRRRLGEGRCRTCGYDLRATPERCPECGTVPG